jgi:RNA polymerase sigma-70 factor (ECF subfamily)
VTELVADDRLLCQANCTHQAKQSSKLTAHGPDVDRFAEVVLPHLDAAYNLARWLLRNDADAEDVVQDSYVRALRYFGGYRGGDARAWLLTIVRNACYRWLHSNRAGAAVTAFDEEIHSGRVEAPNPETILLKRADSHVLELAMSQLPVRFREVLVLRELEGLSYREIADVVGVPMGTVMSSLSRARERFRQTVIDLTKHDKSSSTFVDRWGPSPVRASEARNGV